MRSMRSIFAVGTAAIALLVTPGTAQAWPSTPPPDKIIIDVVTINGSGCKPGTAEVAVSEDNTAFTVTYSEYLAQVGVGAKPTDFRKNCQLSLRVHVPGGFTYAVAQADYRGFHSLQEGSSGVERANYYFQGQSPTASIPHTILPEDESNWQTTDSVDAAFLVWHPCGELKNININTSLLVDKGSSDTRHTTSFMTIDSTDVGIATKYHLAWKKCNA